MGPAKDKASVANQTQNLNMIGCLFQIFLSGFRGSTLDKLRKIINIGGATRCNQITDNVTHVVIGDRINSDIEQIKALATRPHTVTTNWLVECYKQEEHVGEANFYSSELPAPEPSSPQLKKYGKKLKNLDILKIAVIILKLGKCNFIIE